MAYCSNARRQYLQPLRECVRLTSCVPPLARAAQGTGDCYEVIWQLVLNRPIGDETAPWQTVSFAQMHQGFNGQADGPCSEALAPLG